jgi:hypothetical protein
VSPDGKSLALACTDAAVRLVKPYSGEEIRRLHGHRHGVTSVAFSPDGRTLASGGADNAICLWDMSNGNQRHRLQAHWGYVPCLTFSPDGKTLASTGAALGTVRLWDVAMGTLLRDFGDPKKMYHSVAFTPDGKLLAASEWPGVTVWETASGRQFNRLSGPRAAIQFSRNGHALWAKDADESLGLWEVATGALRMKLAGHGALIHGIALTPDGRILASGSADTTVLLWDASGRNQANNLGAVLTPAQLDVCWTDLVQDDGRRAHQAILSLASDPVRAAPFLRERLQPIPAELVTRLITELDSAKFSVRDKATRELQAMGKSVEKPLRDALAHAISLEHRRRLEQLLERAGKQVLSRQQVRSLRAIEALEAMATAEARQVLEVLTRAAAGTLEQVEAQAARERLEPRARPTRE